MIRCVVIEDEQPARELLRSYIALLPDWQLVADFDNAIDAMSFLSRQSVDVIFLDIQLPRLTGIGFLRALEHPPLVVITTAYSEHAVEAFELTVFDYLLKPFPFERFLKTSGRIQQQLQGSHTKEEKSTEPDAHILVRADRRNVKLPVSEILFIESRREYIRIVCAGRELSPRMGITKIESELVNDGFLRVHRSFLVAVAKIDSFTGTELRMGKHVIPIGRLYQREVKTRLER